MKQVIVISDSFKGSLSSGQIAAIAAKSIPRFFPECCVTALPVADGGEGTVDCFLQAVGGSRVMVPVTGPWGEPICAAYARIGDTAVVEMAAAAGLPMVGARLDPSQTTTFGVGQLMSHAVQAGAKHIILGLGGSATNDGGCGAACAMGAHFYDESGAVFNPVGKTLSHIAKIDAGPAQKLLAGVSVEVMCDIDNPLCGPHGAAAVFAPQKGADAAMVRQLDQALAHLAQIVHRDLGKDVKLLPGAGAAGGFGAGAAAFFDAALRPGIEVVLDMVHFDTLLDGCDLVITGEGCMDGQSLSGKTPVGVARRAKRKRVPVVAIVGAVRDDAHAVYDEGISAIFPIGRLAQDFEKVKARSAQDYRSTLEDLLRYTAAVGAFGAVNTSMGEETP